MSLDTSVYPSHQKISWMEVKFQVESPLDYEVVRHQEIN